MNHCFMVEQPGSDFVKMVASFNSTLHVPGHVLIVLYSSYMLTSWIS